MEAPTPASLGHAHRQLAALVSLATQLLRLDSYDDMLTLLVTRSFEILGADRGFLVVQGPGGLDFKVVRNWSAGELQSQRDEVSRAVIEEVHRARAPMLVQDALTDPRFSTSRSVELLQIRSVLAAPLALEAASGTFYLESRRPERLFDEHDLETFSMLVSLGERTLEACARRMLLEARNRTLEKGILEHFDFEGVVGRDARFRKALETVAQVAIHDVPVLVLGPSGTGKELIARALHLNGPRSSGPFVAVNCGALPQGLVESELFGHVRGAFTGADRHKVGLVGAAHRGTLFLDEVGDLPKDAQVKLLRVLQSGEVQPVGATKVEVVDLRIVSATNRDLEADVRAGTFREDLYYRIRGITIELPPLKERPDDILPLFHHFLRQAALKVGRETPVVTPCAERALLLHDWPGNVRELENEARRGLALTPLGAPLTADRLSQRLASRSRDREGPPTLAEQEKELIELHLRLSGGNRSHAARSLGISREGLRQKLIRYRI